MYYIGTKQECIDYDTLVTQNENYAYEIDNWASPKKHPTEEKWAIIAHLRYTSSMVSESTLDQSWFPQEP